MASFVVKAVGAWCPPSADGLRLSQSVCPETHVFGGTEWERAKPDPRAGHGQSKDRSRGWCGPQRAARGHGPGGDDATGGACLLTFRGRSVGRTNNQDHVRAGVSGRQPVEPLPCPSAPCETRAPRGSLPRIQVPAPEAVRLANVRTQPMCPPRKNSRGRCSRRCEEHKAPAQAGGGAAGNGRHPKGRDVSLDRP